MRYSPRRRTMTAFGAVAVVGVLAALGAGLAPAALKSPAAKRSVAAPKTTVITVTAGKPSELAFKLSKSSMVPAGSITFKVTNMGIAFHNFRLCARPIAIPTAAKNACAGKGTPTLKHGQSATFTVNIAKTGLYEFLCTITGHAAAGMKGLLGVGVAVTAAQEKAASKVGAASNTGGTTTTAGGGGGGGGGGGTTTSATTTRPGSG